MTLLDYWPTKDEIKNCIKDQAENASDGVLLGVHQASPLANYKVGPDGKVLPNSGNKANEDELLKDLISEEVASGAHVVPITGISGAGKSHLIRILDAKLRRIKGAERYLVIRVPKTASLRRVVELILEVEPLKDSRYDRIKSEFETALEDIPLHEAVINFEAQLEISLLDYASSLEDSIRNDPQNTALREKAGHAKKLPVFMREEKIIGHFREKIYPRIIERTVGGIKNTEDEGIIDSTDRLFRVADFDLQDLNMEGANHTVVLYWSSLTADGERRKTAAVEVLNHVVDQATRQLYSLNQSIGGMTLGEVILEIRKLLLTDKKELILLVEDFAALVGIQDTLAKVLIQEGYTDGIKKYATLRSAIAVTDGYLAGRDTLATRAGREWVVESRFKSDEVLARTKALVASYINAARCGEVHLNRHYRQAFSSGASDGSLLRPPLFNEDSEGDVPNLSKFGHEKSVPLFPFTDLAIEYLAKDALTEGGELVFSPRFIIKNVITEVLNHREDFEKGQFPNDTIFKIKPSIDIIGWLQHLPVSDSYRNRYRALVTIWGNNPKEIKDIDKIPKEVFEVFGLSKPDISLGEEKEATESTTSKKKSNWAEPKKEKPKTNKNQRLFEKYKDELDKWVQDEIKLSQNTANLIRKELVALVNDRIDWNAERCIKRKFKSSDFSIPNAGGEGNISTFPIDTSSCKNYAESSLPSEFKSLIRFSIIFEKELNYPEVSDDLVKISNLADRLIPQALQIVRNETIKKCRLAILALSENSTILGNFNSKQTLKGLNALLFSEVEEIEEIPNNAPPELIDWLQFKNNARKVRPSLLNMVVELTGCFQGKGTTPNGIDIARILDVVTTLDDRLDVNQLDWIDSGLLSQLKSMTFVRAGAHCKKLFRVVKNMNKLVDTSLGENPNRSNIANELKLLAESLSGAWRHEDLGFGRNTFIEACDAFKAVPFSMTSQLDKAVDSEEDFNKKESVAQFSRCKFTPLFEAEYFVNMSEKLVGVTVKRADTLESQFEGVDSQEASQAIIEKFDKIIRCLNSL
jgi:hypothetical protein